MEEMVRMLPEPTRLVLIQQADHFFTGHLDALRRALKLWIEDMLRSGGVAV
jgi:alpha/beta superfamily hydrolase